MKASELINSVKEMIALHGDLDVCVMQEHNAKKDGIHQIESDVTDIACDTKTRIIIIGQELI